MLGAFKAPASGAVVSTLLGALAKADGEFRTDDKAFDSRFDLAGVAWEMIQAQPFTGIGLNSFEECMTHYDPNHIAHIIRQPVHNGFLLVAAESGIPALLILFGVLRLFIRTSFRILKKGGDELHFVMGLTGLATFGGLGLANMFDVSLRKESVMGLIVLIAAMLVSLVRMDEAQAGEKAAGQAAEHHVQV